MKYRINDTLHDFRVVGVKELEEYNVTIYQFEHKVNGARAFWIDNKQMLKEFKMGFLTPAVSDNGINSAIANMVLGASPKYNVISPVDELKNYAPGLSTDIAVASDKTVYSASTRVDSEFHKIIDVYLSGAFNSIDSWSQEKFMDRVIRFKYLEDYNEFTIEGNIVDYILKYKNDKTNGMLNRVLALSDHMVYPNTCYSKGYNGDFKQIVRLELPEVKAAYKRLYHPSNCVFCISGNCNLDIVLKLISSAVSEYKDKLKPLVIPEQISTPSASERISMTSVEAECEDMYILSFLGVNLKDKLKTAMLDIMIEYLVNRNQSAMNMVLAATCNSSTSNVRAIHDTDRYQTKLMLEFTDLNIREDANYRNACMNVVNQALNFEVDKKELFKCFSRYCSEYKNKINNGLLSDIIVMASVYRDSFLDYLLTETDLTRLCTLVINDREYLEIARKIITPESAKEIYTSIEQTIIKAKVSSFVVNANYSELLYDVDTYIDEYDYYKEWRANMEDNNNSLPDLFLDVDNYGGSEYFKASNIRICDKVKYRVTKTDDSEFGKIDMYFAIGESLVYDLKNIIAAKNPKLADKFPLFAVSLFCDWCRAKGGKFNSANKKTKFSKLDGITMVNFASGDRIYPFIKYTSKFSDGEYIGDLDDELSQLFDDRRLYALDSAKSEDINFLKVFCVIPSMVDSDIVGKAMMDKTYAISELRFGLTGRAILKEINKDPEYYYPKLCDAFCHIFNNLFVRGKLSVDISVPTLTEDSEIDSIIETISNRTCYFDSDAVDTEDDGIDYSLDLTDKLFIRDDCSVVVSKNTGLCFRDLPSRFKAALLAIWRKHENPEFEICEDLAFLKYTRFVEDLNFLSIRDEIVQIIDETSECFWDVYKQRALSVITNGCSDLMKYDSLRSFLCSDEAQYPEIINELIYLTPKDFEDFSKYLREEDTNDIICLSGPISTIEKNTFLVEYKKM